MHKTRKNLLGLAGLAIVGIMTIIALNMPILGASAVDTTDTSSGNVDVHVTVAPDPSKTDASIVTPSDGVTVVDGVLKVSASYSQAKKLTFYLSYKDKDGKIVDKGIINTYDVPADKASDIYSFEYDLKALGAGYTEYILTMHTDFIGGTAKDDAVSFHYGSVSTDVDPDTNKPGKDPVIDVDINDDVEYVEVVVIGPDGKPALVDKDGKPITIKVNKDDIGPDGKLHITLPFDEYGLPAGDYSIIITGFDKNGNVLSTNITKLPYQTAGGLGPDNPTGPVTPNTPNTGTPFLGDLNISHLDYILSGVAVFTVVAGFALYLVFRKNRR